MKKFILAVEGLSNETAKELVSIFEKNNLGYWHYVGDLWLIYAKHDTKINASWIRDEVGKLGKNNCFAMEVPDGYMGWAARSPKNSHEWLHTYWA